MERRDWVVIEQVDNSIQAELIRGLLEQQGILAVIKHEGEAFVDHLHYGLESDFDILVKRQDEHKAKELLAEYYLSEPEEDN